MSEKMIVSKLRARVLRLMIFRVHRLSKAAKCEKSATGEKRKTVGTF